MARRVNGLRASGKRIFGPGLFGLRGRQIHGSKKIGSVIRAEPRKRGKGRFFRLWRPWVVLNQKPWTTPSFFLGVSVSVKKDILGP